MLVQTLKWGRINGNDKFIVRLSAAMNPSDANAMDVKYHITCWDENVTNVLRKMLSKLRAKNVLHHFGSHGNWIQEMYIIESMNLTKLLCIV